MTGNDPQDDTWNSTQEKLQRWYDLYLLYAKKSQAAILAVTLNPASKQEIAKEQPMSKEEFERAVCGIESDEKRMDYLHRLEMGYDAARLAFRGNSLYKLMYRSVTGEEPPPGNTRNR